MNASNLATAGVQPGDTHLRRALARLDKLRDLALIDGLVTALEESGCTSPAVDIHRAARDRLQRELGLPVSESIPHVHREQ